MRLPVLTLLLFPACVPNLVSPNGGTDTGPVALWEAPDNTWPTTTPPEGLVAQGFEAGDVIPDFRLVDQHGDEVSLWQFHGNVVVVDISTMWCSPCRELAEGAEETSHEFLDKGFVYLTILPENVERHTPSQDDLNAWGDHYGITQPIVSDPDRAYSAPAVPGDSFPQVLVVDRDLTVYRRLSVPTDAALRAVVSEIIE